MVPLGNVSSSVPVVVHRRLPSPQRHRSTPIAMPPPPAIPSAPFYSEYHGHPLPSLHAIHASIPPTTPLLYLAGDSTLDNKHWLSTTVPSLPPLSLHLTPPTSRPDVAHHLNALPFRSAPFATLNLAVEESTLRSRARTLPPHDAFIAAHLRPADVLVVSAAANDVALTPSPLLVLAVLVAVYLSPALARPALRALLVRPTERYVRALVARARPRLVLLCALYFLDETPAPSWAAATLAVLLYNRYPGRLQALIRVFAELLDEFAVDGVPVVTVPLFEALDGKCTRDYVDRVEPSEQGGRKIAVLIRDAVDRALLPGEHQQQSPHPQPPR